MNWAMYCFFLIVIIFSVLGPLITIQLHHLQLHLHLGAVSIKNTPLVQKKL